MTDGGGDPNSVEIKITVGGDAVKQAKELAAGLNEAAEAEAKLQAATAERTHADKRAARAKAETDQQQERLAAFKARMRAKEDESQKAERRRQYNQTPEGEARRQFAAEKRQEMIGRHLDKLRGGGKAKTGIAGFAQKADNFIGLPPGTAEKFITPLTKLAGPMGALAAAAMAGKFALDVAVGESERMKTGNPFATDDFLTERRQIGNLPLAKEFYDLKDLATGRARDFEKMNRRQMIADRQEAFKYDGFRQQMDQAAEERTARAGAVNARAYAVPGAPNIDRSTAKGEQQFRLAQRILPLEERRAEASQARANAEAAHSAQLEKVRKIEAESARLNRENADIKSNFKGPNGNALIGSAYYVEAEIHRGRNFDRLEQLDKDRLSASQAAKGTAGNLARAKYGESQANIATASERYKDLREREDVATGRAANLGRSGAQDRQLGLNAMQLIRQADDIDSIPPQLLEVAAKYFPEEMQKIFEAKGQQEFGRFNAAGPDSYRDDPVEIRKAANAAQQEVQKSKQDANVALADDMVAAAVEAGTVGGEKLGETIVNVIRATTDALVARVEEQLQAAGIKEGYQSPR